MKQKNKNRRAGKRSGTGQRILIFVLAWALSMAWLASGPVRTALATAQPSSQADSCLMIAADQEHEIASFAVVLLSDGPDFTGAFVMTLGIGLLSDLDVSDIHMELVGKNQSYPLVYMLDDCNGYVTLWETSDAAILQEPAGLTAGMPTANETVTVVYVDSSFEVQTSTSRITDHTQADFGHLLTLSDEITDAAYFPGVLLDSSGCCVGSLIGTSTGYLAWLDEAAFTGGAEGEGGTGGSGTEGGSGTGTGTGTGSGGSGTGTGSGTGKGGSGTGTGSGTSSVSAGNDVLLYVLIGAAAIAVAAAVIWGMKKKGGGKGNGSMKKQKASDDTFPSFHLEEPVSPEPGPAYSDDMLPTENIIAGHHQERVAASQLWLTCRGGYMDGRVYPIGKEPVTIGRGNPSQLVVCYPGDTPGVSRNHARLYLENGRLMLVDCGSSNGTYLKNYGKLSPMQPRELQVGDVFYIGEKKNRFEIKN